MAVSTEGSAGEREVSGVRVTKTGRSRWRSRDQERSNRR